MENEKKHNELIGKILQNDMLSRKFNDFLINGLEQHEIDF